MKTFRIALWALVGVVAVMVGVLALQSTRHGAPEFAGAGEAAIGGPFTLVDQRGRTVTREDLIGTPHALFFGYTHCPDVCPTTLWEMAAHMKRLGERADDMKVVFVTVDPARDTPEALAAYVSNFDERMLALSGSREAVDEAVRNYRAFYKIHEPDEQGDILVDHTASVYLFDASGAFRGTIAYGEAPDTAFAKLERLV